MCARARLRESVHRIELFQSMLGTNDLKMNLLWIDLLCCFDKKSARAAKDVKRTSEAKNASHRMANWNTNRKYNKETRSRKIRDNGMGSSWMADCCCRCKVTCLSFDWAECTAEHPLPFQLTLKMVSKPHNLETKNGLSTSSFVFDAGLASLRFDISALSFVATSQYFYKSNRALGVHPTYTRAQATKTYTNVLLDEIQFQRNSFRCAIKDESS